MRRLLLTAAAAAAAVAVPGAQAAPVEVLVRDDYFKPKRVPIKKDRRVVWRWRGSSLHNVAIKRPGSNKVVRRSAVKTSGSFRHKFRRTGTWRVLCEVHPKSMRMRVIVER
jgi:plastocyanin